MSRYFNFYDPLEKRYVFNSFLVVAALVEILILVFTCIWQIDEGIFSDQVKVIPFPWKEYLLATVTAPIILLFLFGVVVRGFELISREGASPAPGQGNPGQGRKRGRRLYLWGLLVLGGVLLLLWGLGFAHLTSGVKALGLGGTYLLIALLALTLLYFPFRLWLRYRLQKKVLEYQYLLTLAERHGVVLVDKKKLPPGVTPLGPGGKLPGESSSRPAPEKIPEEPESQ